MGMGFTDWLGFLGVMLLLAAYFLTSFNFIRTNSIVFMALNCIGAVLACVASILLHYLPFVILEGTWFVIALVSWIKRKG